MKKNVREPNTINNQESESRLKNCLHLFCGFFNVGLLTFGGGYSMLPMFIRVAVEKNGWLTKEELLDYYAVGQCMPGAIAVNTAALTGMKVASLPGALAAVAGIVTPSLIIILIIATLLTGFNDNPYVRHALSGIKVAVCGIVAVTVARMFKTSITGVFTAAVAVGAFSLLFFAGLNPIIVVAIAAAAGIGFGVINAARTKSRRNNSNGGGAK